MAVPCGDCRGKEAYLWKRKISTGQISDSVMYRQIRDYVANFKDGAWDEGDIDRQMPMSY